VGRQKGKRQVVVYLAEKTYRRLKVRAAHEDASMSSLVERALEGGAGARPSRGLSRAAEPPLSPGAAALIAHGAPLLGRPPAERRPLEEAVALGVRESRAHPAVLRALIVVLAKSEVVDWAEVQRHLAPGELPALGAVIDLTAAATEDVGLRRVADELFAEVGARDEAEPFFTRPALARYSLALRERTPEAMRRWGFVCATPIEDFQEAVRRFADLRPN
jgi:hypothetical protein